MRAPLARVSRTPQGGADALSPTSLGGDTVYSMPDCLTLDVAQCLTPDVAQTVDIEPVDDIDGKAADSAVTFAPDGRSYKIDLRTRNADRL